MSARATEQQETTAKAVAGGGVSHMLFEWEHPVTFCGHVTSRPYSPTPTQPNICAVCLAQAIAWGVAP